VIYDTASIATLHALVAAREAAVPGVRTHGIAGRGDVPRLSVYTSDHGNLSIDRAVIAAGLGQESLRRIPVDDEFRMRAPELAAAIAADRAAGCLPIAVVPTVGTTITTSVDPVPAIADICERERLWLHVDAAYAGVAAMLPSHADILAGAERADSIVVNPHKWLFTPFDLSAFYSRRMDVVRAAFSMTPSYLSTPDQSGIKNLMDTGVQLGRRFRALKLWMILRSFGARELRTHLARHISLAREFAEWVDAHPEFERMAPVRFSVVCFRWNPPGAGLPESELDAANERLVAAVNDSGQVFLATARLNGRVTIRLAIGHLRTTETHVHQAWDLITSSRPSNQW
jgi:aromatic-L-amino-acid decarboxylase